MARIGAAGRGSDSTGSSLQIGSFWSLALGLTVTPPEQEVTGSNPVGRVALP
jgi:hypothetical protein